MQSASQTTTTTTSTPSNKNNTEYIPVEARWEHNLIALEAEERERSRAALAHAQLGPSLRDIEMAKLRILSGDGRVRFFGGYRELS